jgi:hypothetical protein
MVDSEVLSPLVGEIRERGVRRIFTLSWPLTSRERDWKRIKPEGT